MLVTVIDINEGGLGTILKVSSPITIPEGYVSLPQSAEFARIDGSGKAHGFWYAHKDAEFEGPPGSLPPLIVAVHVSTLCFHPYFNHIIFGGRLSMLR